MTAADTMNNAVLSWAKDTIPEIPEDTQVVVRVYANVKGIADACASNGIISHPSQVEEFVRGFTSVNSLSDFTNVGGLESVDGKIIGKCNNSISAQQLNTDHVQKRSSSTSTTTIAVTFCWVAVLAIAISVL